MAERVGFEPTVEFPQHTLSKRAPSTTRTPLRKTDGIESSRKKKAALYSTRPSALLKRGNQRRREIRC
jgi:hypothetical protein